MSQQNTKALNKFIELARYIAANADEQLTLAMLAARVHLSPSRFQRVFKSIFGVSPKKFQQAARSDRFKALLRSTAPILPRQFMRQGMVPAAGSMVKPCITSA